MWIHEKDLKLDNVLDVVITEVLVLKALRNLKPDKSPRPDNIHPMVLRETTLDVINPLTMIFQKSIYQGELPDYWKKRTYRTHKKGLKDEARNYRPASLTFEVCKLLESIVKEQMVNFLIKRIQFLANSMALSKGDRA